MTYHDNPVLQLLDMLLIATATATGYLGLHLNEVDLVLAIVLKGVSIISFILLIIINWAKIKKTFKKKTDDND